MTAIFGIFSAFALVLAAMFMGGPLASFFNPGGILIVVFGTIAVTSVSFSGRELVDTPSTIWQLLSQKPKNPTKEAHKIIQLSEKARKDDLVKLEKQLLKSKSSPLFLKGIQLLIDGIKSDYVENLMLREAGTIQAKSLKSVDVLRRAGEVSPAMGLIGTLVGLIQMLGNLDDPSTIGKAMAIALLTTFYGAILAHMFFIPLAARIERISGDQALLNSVYALGASSIGRRENPRQLEIILNTILPPEQKVRYFD